MGCMCIRLGGHFIRQGEGNTPLNVKVKRTWMSLLPSDMHPSIHARDDCFIGFNSAIPHRMRTPMEIATPWSHWTLLPASSPPAPSTSASACMSTRATQRWLPHLVSLMPSYQAPVVPLSSPSRDQSPATLTQLTQPVRPRCTSALSFPRPGLMHPKARTSYISSLLC